MWHIKSIEAFNFFSHKELQYKLVNNSLTMVYGNNLDISKKKSNGSGKSVILDVISFAITGDCLRKLKSIKKIIQNGEDSCEVRIELENKALKSELKIIRTLGRKETQKIFITYNKSSCDQLRDLHPRESDKFIEEKLGISFEDLLNYYLISKFKYQSLFLANDSTKKEVINRFSKADLIDGVFEHIDNDLDIENGLLHDIENSLIKNKTTIELYEKQLEELINEQSDEKKKEQISLIELQITQKKNNQQTFKKEINVLLSKKVEINKQIDDKKLEIIKEVELKKWDKSIETQKLLLSNKRLEYSGVRDKYKGGFETLDAEETECDRLIKEYESNIKAFDKCIKDLENFIAGEIECPKCKHHFILADKEFNVDNAKKEIELYNNEKVGDEKKLAEIKQFFEKVNTDRKELNNKISSEQISLEAEADKIKEDLNKLENKKLELVRSNNKIAGEISEFEKQIKTKDQDIKFKENQIVNEEKYITQYKLDIVEVKKDKNKVAIECKNKDIEDETGLTDTLQTSKDSLLEKIAKIEEWKNKFKRFKSFLANQSISQIQQQSNYFLKKMKSDLMVFIDGFRPLTNGKIKEEITVEISRDGLEGEEFGAFSGGEKSVTDLSCILSMQNIINATSSTGGLNFLGIDEILESVDEEGMNDVSKCLSNLNQTIILIAHSQPNESIECNKLFIERKNRISKIVNNEIIVKEKELV